MSGSTPWTRLRTKSEPQRWTRPPLYICFSPSNPPRSSSTSPLRPSAAPPKSKLSPIPPWSTLSNPRSTSVCSKPPYSLAIVYPPDFLPCSIHPPLHPSPITPHSIYLIIPSYELITVRQLYSRRNKCPSHFYLI